MSLIALLIALISAFVAVYAVSVARDAKSTAAAGSPSTPRPPDGHTTTQAAPATTAPTDPDTTAPAAPTATPGDLNPQATFTNVYAPAAQTLVVHPPGCGTNWIDLDRPAVNVGGSNTGDLGLRNCSGSEWQVSNGVQVAEAPSADQTPNDCARLIQTGALPDVSIPVTTPNLVLCVTTSFNAAQDQGISWKIVLVKVNSVSQDGSVSITVTAWNIPQ